MSARTSSATVVSATLALLAGPLAAQSTIRVSVSSTGAQANYASWRCSVSADGKCIAFQSNASDLVAGDTNGVPDVFVRDRVSGTTERISVDSAGQQVAGPSEWPSISADGRFVAFSSQADSLVAGDTNNVVDIFVHDRQTGTTERVSVGAGGAQADGASSNPSISADGRYVAYSSTATNLVAGDTNLVGDVFVRDRILGLTELVSISSTGTQSDGNCERAAISGDGTCVAFRSLGTNLVAGDTNLKYDIFVRDRVQATTERVSVGPGGSQSDGASDEPRLSADGRYVAFTSDAASLVAGDSNAWPDIFVRDRQLGSTERVSVSSAGVQANLPSGRPSLSADGRFVAFQSAANNLLNYATYTGSDIFVHDRQLGTTECASRSSSGTPGLAPSFSPSISADGRFVGFHGSSGNLVTGDTNAADDVFLRDRGLPAPVVFCLAEGSSGPCPCGNSGLFGGCDTSAQTGGAALSGTGTPALLADTLVLNSTNELPTALSIVLQGDAVIAPVGFGDGIRCVGGTLRRLYSLPAVGGAVSVPPPGAQSISERSAALGDLIPAGSTRVYQVYYRDPVASFCPPPQGNNWNVSSALSVQWGW